MATQTELKTGFTPGPWDYERAVDPRDVERPWIGRLNEQRYSALACGENADEAWANARLIAAAPELYEALVALLDYVAGDDPEGLPVFEKATAALAKARDTDMTVEERARQLWEDAEARVLASPHTIPTRFEGAVREHFIKLARGHTHSTGA